MKSAHLLLAGLLFFPFGWAHAAEAGAPGNGAIPEMTAGLPSDCLHDMENRIAIGTTEQASCDSKCNVLKLAATQGPLSVNDKNQLSICLALADLKSIDPSHECPWVEAKSFGLALSDAEKQKLRTCIQAITQNHDCARVRALSTSAQTAEDKVTLQVCAFSHLN